MGARWTIVAAVVGMLIVGPSVGRAADDAGGMDTRATVQQMAGEGHHGGNPPPPGGGGPGGPPGGHPGHDGGHDGGWHDDPPHQRLGTYPHWYRLHHRYGYDYPRYQRWDSHYAPFYPYSGYSLYGYWDNDRVIYVPYRGEYTGGDAYRDYIFVEPPAVPEQAPVPAAPAATPAPAQPADGEQFESALSPMLGGADRVGLAFALGEISLKAGQSAEAVTAFRQALRSDPGGPAVRLAFALALTAESDYMGAAQMARLGLGGVARLDDLVVDGVAVFGSAEALDAVVAKVQAASEKEQGADVQLALGFVCFATGRYDTARNALWAAYEAANGDVTVGRLLLAAERRLRAQPKAAGETSDEVPGDK